MISPRAGSGPLRSRARSAAVGASPGTISVPATVSLSIESSSTSTLPTDRCGSSGVDDIDGSGVEVLGDQRDAARGVRRTGELLDPFAAQFGGLGIVEDEAQRDRRVQPDRAATARLIVGVLPRDREALAPAQLGRDDDFQVRESAIVDVDRSGRSAVVDGAHRATISPIRLRPIIAVESGPRVSARGLREVRHELVAGLPHDVRRLVALHAPAVLERSRRSPCRSRTRRTGR